MRVSVSATTEPGLSMPAGAMTAHANDTITPVPTAVMVSATVELYWMIGRAIVNANDETIRKAQRRNVVGVQPVARLRMPR